MKILSIVDRLFSKTVAYFAVLTGILLAFVTGLVNVNIILRKYFEKPIIWQMEVTEFSLLWVTFLGMAWVLKEEAHVSVDLILVRLSPKAQHTLIIIASILGIIAFAIFTWYGTVVTLDYFRTGYYMQGTPMRPPKGPIMMIIPIGSLLVTIQFFKRTLKHIKLLRESTTGVAASTGIGEY